MLMRLCVFVEVVYGWETRRDRRVDDVLMNVVIGDDIVEWMKEEKRRESGRSSSFVLRSAGKESLVIKSTLVLFRLLFWQSRTKWFWSSRDIQLKDPRFAFAGVRFRPKLGWCLYTNVNHKVTISLAPINTLFSIIELGCIETLSFVHLCLYFIEKEYIAFFGSRLPFRCSYCRGVAASSGTTTD